MFFFFCLFWRPFIASFSLSSRISQILDSILSGLFRPGSHWSVGMWLMEGRAAPHFSCSVYTVLQSLTYQHSNYKANTKCDQTDLILLNFLAVPRLSETLIAKAQGSSFGVSLESALRLPARHAKFHMVLCFLLTAVVQTLASIQSWFSTSSLCFLSYKHYLQIFSLPHQRADSFMSANLFQSCPSKLFLTLLQMFFITCWSLCSPIPVLGAALFVPAAALLSSSYIQSCLGHQHLPVCQNF